MGRKALLLLSGVGMLVSMTGAATVLLAFRVEEEEEEDSDGSVAGYVTVVLVCLFVFNFAYGWGYKCVSNSPTCMHEFVVHVAIIYTMQN